MRARPTIGPSLAAPGPPATLRLRTIGGAENLLVDEMDMLAPCSFDRDRPGIVDLAPGPAAGWPDLLTEVAARRFYSGAEMRVIGPPGDSAVEQARRALRTVEPGPPRPDPADPQAAQLIELTTLRWPNRHHRLRRLPWSTSPALAEVLIRLAKVEAGTRVLDPCCGSGTILVAAAQARAGYVYGTDRDPVAVTAARSNLSTVGLPLAAEADLGDGTVDIRLADASRLTLADGSVDRVISNLPFGKRVGSHQGNERFYPSLLTELERVLAPGGRTVLLTEDKALLVATVQHTPGIKIVRSRLFRYNGATPTAYVITRTRGRN